MGRGSSGTGGGRGGARSGGGAHQFPEKAISGWEYEGDGEATRAFFMENSNVDELIRGMDDETRAAFRSWARGTFMDGAQYGGWDNMVASDQKLTLAYDRILDQSVLNASMTVVRRSDTQLVMGAGRKTATLEELRAAKGSIVTSAGSMSTGAASEGLTIGDDRKPIEYRMTFAKGSKGAGMWIGDSRINGWDQKQREFMTNRDVSFRVGDTRYDSKRGIFITDLQYVGRQAHDYGKAGRP